MSAEGARKVDLHTRDLSAQRKHLYLSGLSVDNKSYFRCNLMAFSGHADTHSPHARHASALTAKLCFQPCSVPLTLARKGRPLRSSAGRISSSNTLYGQMTTQSALPSQRARSMAGVKTPG